MPPGLYAGYSGRIAQTDHPFVVVVADDDAAFRMLLRVNLELEGYRVLEAENAARVQETVSGGSVNLVLLDVRLGDDDGIALARDLREEHPEVAIAFLTGSAIGPAQDAEGASDAVIQKPFDLEELSATVARLTRR
jgi:two-component system torCAD operon response regulator TorR